MKYTIKDFREHFPNETACLDYLFKRRAGRKFPCQKCGKVNCFYRIRSKKTYGCAWCGYQVSPMAGTIFHKSSTPLVDWFYAIYLMGQSKNGVSAKELQRHLGVTYKTAWRMQKQIRSLMEQGKDALGGTVEIDETYIGGRRRKVRGRGGKGKAAVIGVVQRKGKIRARVVSNVKLKTVGPILRRSIKIGAEIMTDDFPIYDRLKREGYNHKVIQHSRKRYVDGRVHTNTVEGFWSQLKRSIRGTYHSVSQKHLQSYVDEFVWRYNRRSSEVPMFFRLLDRAGRTAS